MTGRPRTPEPLRAMAGLAHRLSWRITLTGGGHLRWQAPDGTAVITASTPSDRRGSRNDRSRLRRAGLKETS